MLCHDVIVIGEVRGEDEVGTVTRKVEEDKVFVIARNSVRRHPHHLVVDVPSRGFEFLFSVCLHSNLLKQKPWRKLSSQ